MTEMSVVLPHPPRTDQEAQLAEARVELDAAGAPRCACRPQAEMLPHRAAGKTARLIGRPPQARAPAPAGC